ncbi:MAG: NrfD/PsrC family molybdoenzyme membrane anchor subunit [Planctomycetota bacterium]|jgi:Ni/Fe-hydrogenase subunit HybB-like protein
MFKKDYRLSFWRGLFFLFLAIGAVITWIRFSQGIGAVSNLSDRYPWGLWVGFDLLCGIGLAAGSFVIVAAVYIFNLKRFQPLVRPALLTGFLGYMLEVFALMFDLGRPWNIWRPLISGNMTSVMAVVAWCVVTYSAIMALEASGMVFEKLRWPRALKVQKAITLPLVIVGVLFAMLHQGSLGSLYLIVPGKLHGFWYSSWLPILFLASSISAGLGMVIVESRLSSRAFGRALEMPLLTEVGRVLAAVLGFYGVLRIYDLGVRGMIPSIFSFEYEAVAVQLELMIGLVLPVGLLLLDRVRQNVTGLYTAALLVVMGFILNRMNVSITGFEGAQGGRYLPSWSEVMVSLMLVSIGIAAFGLCVKYFKVYPDENPAPEPVQPRSSGQARRLQETSRA